LQRPAGGGKRGYLFLPAGRDAVGRAVQYAPPTAFYPKGTGMSKDVFAPGPALWGPVRGREKFSTKNVYKKV